LFYCYLLFVFAVRYTLHVCIRSYQANNQPNQRWFIDGDYVASETKKVLDVRGNTNNAGTQVIAYASNNQENQKWEIVTEDKIQYHDPNAKKIVLAKLLSTGSSTSSGGSGSSGTPSAIASPKIENASQQSMSKYSPVVAIENMKTCPKCDGQGGFSLWGPCSKDSVHVMVRLTTKNRTAKFC